MRYLLNTVETWRVDTVDDALAMRDELDAASEYDISTFSYTAKYDKKAEEEYVVVKVKKIIQAEKDCSRGVTVTYEN